MTNPCECSECNCENVRDDPETDTLCASCSRGVHRAEREWRAGQEETRARIAKEEKVLKDRED